ncbi:unnamed protein product [Ixodes persulcatus]
MFDFCRVNKKIVTVARAKKHSVRLKWIKTIIRHLHWCARTSHEDGKLVLAKWTYQCPRAP